MTTNQAKCGVTREVPRQERQRSCQDRDCQERDCPNRDCPDRILLDSSGSGMNCPERAADEFGCRAEACRCRAPSTILVFAAAVLLAGCLAVAVVETVAARRADVRRGWGDARSMLCDAARELLIDPAWLAASAAIGVVLGRAKQRKKPQRRKRRGAVERLESRAAPGSMLPLPCTLLLDALAGEADVNLLDEFNLGRPGPRGASTSAVGQSLLDGPHGSGTSELRPDSRSSRSTGIDGAALRPAIAGRANRWDARVESPAAMPSAESMLGYLASTSARSDAQAERGEPIDLVESLDAAAAGDSSSARPLTRAARMTRDDAPARRATRIEPVGVEPVGVEPAPPTSFTGRAAGSSATSPPLAPAAPSVTFPDVTFPDVTVENADTQTESRKANTAWPSRVGGEDPAASSAPQFAESSTSEAELGGNPAAAVVVAADSDATANTAPAAALAAGDAAHAASTDGDVLTPACNAGDGLAGWTVAEYGGSGAGAGSVTFDQGQLVLHEGNSFLVTAEQQVVIPAAPDRLVVEFRESLAVGDEEWINDAFEIALLDAEDRPVVPVIQPAADAQINVTESSDAAADESGWQTATLDISSLTPGNAYRLVLRLVNNDADVASTVTIACGTGTGNEGGGPGDSHGEPNVWIIDDGDDAFALHPTTATASIGPAHWWVEPGETYQQDYHSHDPGDGSYRAEWQFSGLRPGRYHVAVSYPDHVTHPHLRNSATDAPFTVYDDLFPLETVRINQQQPADDFSHRGIAWETLGVYDLVGSTLQVRLTDAADGIVRADAVRVERLSAGPELTVIDVDGRYVDALVPIDFDAPHAADSPIVFVTSVAQPLRRDFLIRNDGDEPLVVTSIELGAAAPTANFSLHDLAAFPITVPPGASETFALTLDAATTAGHGDFPASLHIVSNDADEADWGVPLRGVVRNPSLIDDGDSGFTVHGDWEPADWSYHYQSDAWSTAAVASGGVARWTFEGLPDARYAVATSFAPPVSGGATEAHFTIRDQSGTLAHAVIDQSQPPNDFHVSGAAWEQLSESVSVTGGMLVVELVDSVAGVGELVADAVRIERLWDGSPDVAIHVEAPGLAPQYVADDNGRVDFGHTVPGRPVRREFAVTNITDVPLELGSVIHVPDGFELIEYQTEPQSGGTGMVATFVIEMRAETPGRFGGEVSLATNDPDEQPLNFIVAGVVDESRIIDDADSARFSSTGFTWFPNQGFDSAVRYAGGTTSGAATWTFADLAEGGTYLVSTTWSPGPTRASNAPFTVDGVVGGPTVVAIDQRARPGDRHANGTQFQDLGVFTVDGSTLTVRLSGPADGQLIADAVRIQPLVAPEVELAYGGQILRTNRHTISFGSVAPGTEPVARELEIRNVGTEPARIEGVDLPIGFRLLVPPPEQLDPGQVAAFTVGLERQFSGSYEGQLAVRFADVSSRYVRLEGDVLADRQFVNNEDASPAYTRNNFFRYAGGRLGSFDASQTPGGWALFQFTDLTPGLYRVSSTWTAHLNRSPVAPYTLYDGAPGAAEAQTTILVNQQVAPDDFVDDGTTWEDLAFVAVSGQSLAVRLETVAGGVVEADSVRIERLANQPELVLRTGADATDRFSDDVGADTLTFDTLDFGMLALGSSDVRTLTVHNTGEVPLELTGARASRPFQLVTSLPLVVTPGEATSLAVQFTPSSVGQFAGELWIDSNDSDESPRVVRLTGSSLTGAGDAAEGEGGSLADAPANTAPANTAPANTAPANTAPANTAHTATAHEPSGQAPVVVLDPWPAAGRAGEPVLVSGSVRAPSQPVTVQVNGVAVDALDAAGNFFSASTLRAGDHRFEVVATDGAGDIGAASLVVTGRSSTPPEIDFANLVPAASLGVTAVYGRTTFSQRDDLLYATATLVNNGSFELAAPLLVAVTDLSHPLVRLHDPHGFTPDGTPYYDFSDLLDDGRLSPGESTAPRNFAFYDAVREPFRYELQVFGRLNREPRFTSVPRVEAVAGTPYSYAAAAIDDDQDPLTYALAAAPAGMAIDSTTGRIAWSPELTDAGNHTVVVEVTDGRGGRDLQPFVVSVLDQLPNRPPVWSSTPVTEAYVNIVYSYEGLATDADGDAIVYALEAGPAGLAVDPSSGQVGWAVPAVDQLGSHTVTLRATDEHGAAALQTFELRVLAQPGNHPPVIVSEPATYFASSGGSTTATGQTTPSSIQLHLDAGESVEQPVSVTLPGAELLADVFLLFDDTGSFEPHAPSVVAGFPELIDTLERSLPGVDFAFGVGRFEEYAGYAGELTTGRPFVLNQPIIRTETPGFTEAISGALRRTAPGFGGDGPETLIEALYQVATGAGFDANNDGDTLDSGPAGAIATQLQPEASGDVPAFSSFVPSPDDDVLAPAGTLGGVGFRHGALPVIIVATDYGTAYEPDLVDPLIGAGGVRVPLARFQGFPDPQQPSSRDTTPNGRGASLQETIDALNQLGALVIGLGAGSYTLGPWPQLAMRPDHDPRLVLEAIAEVTGAVNRTDQSLDGGIGPHVHPDTQLWVPADPIDPGDPLYFVIDNELPSVTPPPQDRIYGTSLLSGDHALDLYVLDGLVASTGRLRIADVSGAMHGTVAVSTTGDYLTYTPYDSFVMDRFDVTLAIDGYPAFTTQFAVTLGYPPLPPLPVPDHLPPSANDDQWELTNVRPGHALNLHVLENDNEPNGDPVRIVAVGQPEHGTVSIAATGDLVVYTPPASGLVADQFTYTIADRDGSSTATVQLVSPPDPHPEPFGLAAEIADAVGAALTHTRFDVDLVADSPVFTNLTGVVENVGPGEQAEFVARFVGDGGQHAFELNFVRAGSGLLFGSIPVSINAGYRYRVDAVDPDDDPVTYALLEAPAGATFNSASQRIDWTPPGPGSYPFTMQASDGRGGFDTQEFVVEVTAGQPNEPPLIAPSDTTPPAEPDRAWSYRVDASDPDQDPLTFFLTDAPSGMDIDRESGLVTWTPQRGDLQADLTARTHAFSVRVSDGRGGTDQRDYAVVVHPVATNVAPEIVSQAVSAGEQNSAYRYQAAAQDADADLLAWDLVVHPIGMAVDPSSGLVVWQPGGEDIGRHEIILRVQDGRGGVDLQYWELTVAEENLPPSIVSTPPAGPAVVGREFTYAVRALDPNNDALTFRVDPESAARGVAIDPLDGVLTWTPRPEDQDVALGIAVEVSDGRESASQTVTLAAAAPGTNDPPVILSTPRLRVRANQTWVYRIQAEDPNGDPLAYELLGAAADGPRIVDNVLVWTPDQRQFGAHPLEVRVVDSAGGVASQSFALRVVALHENEDPYITSNPTAAATVGQPYAYDVEALDPDADLVEFQLVEGPRGMVLDPELGTVRWTPTLEQLGAQRVAIRAVDPYGGSDVQRFFVTARATNLPPAITSVPVTIGAASGNYTYPVRGFDPEGARLRWELTVIDAAEQTVDGPTIDQDGVIRWNPPANAAGTYVATVTATDPLDAAASQTWRLVVSDQDGDVDLPPVITSLPSRLASLGEAWVYDVAASDPDGTAVTFSLVESPALLGQAGEAPATIDPDTGRLIWAPAPSHVGSLQAFTVRATSAGEFASQRFALLVLPENREPVITSTPPDSIVAGREYRYDVQASDADGDALEFELINAPDGMTIDTWGRLRWSTAPADVGSYEFAVRATDRRGDVDAPQAITVTVAPDVEPPSATFVAAPTSGRVGQTVEVLVAAVDNVGIVGLALTVGGEPVPLDDRGFGRVTRDEPGSYPVLARIRDLSGNVTTIEESLVFASDDPSAPRLEFTRPGELDGVLTAPVPVHGDVLDPGNDLAWYQLDVLTLAGEPLGTIAYVAGNPLAGVQDGALGSFDPTVLANGAYLLRLTADDLDAENGGPVFIETTVHVGGDLKLGNFSLAFNDVTIPVAGIPITIGRSYDTLRAHQAGDFGYGWKLDLGGAELQVDFPPGRLSNYGGLPAFRDGTRVTLTHDDGTTEGFTFRPWKEVRQFGLVTVWHPYFEPDPGVEALLVVEDIELTQVFGDEYISWKAGGAGYHPANPFFGGTYDYFARDGRIRTLDAATGDLLSVSDRDGNEVRFTRDAIVSNRGRQIDIVRDQLNRITAVTDPRGHSLTYRYDEAGNLVAVTDRVGNAANDPTGFTTTFTYRADPPHYLEELRDPFGVRSAKITYDDQGRVAAVSNAEDNVAEFSFDAAARTQVIADSQGNRTELAFDSRGNVTREVNPAGETTLRQFDDAGRLLEETSADGLVRQFEYGEGGILLLETDTTGLTTRYTYNEAGQTLTITDPLGNTTTNVYGALGDSIEERYQGAPLLMTADADNHATVFRYDDRGQLTTIISGLEYNSFSYYDVITDNYYGKYYDPSCDPAADSACPQPGTTTRFEYDAFGDLTATVDPDARRRGIEHDANGNVTGNTFVWSNPLDEDDVQAVRSSSVFDANDQVIETVSTDGRTTTEQRDALRRAVVTTTAAGEQMQTAFDSRGLAVQTRTSARRSVADGETQLVWLVTRTVFDAAGRVSYRTDPHLDSTPVAEITGTHTVYDEAGRVTATERLRGLEIALVTSDSGLPATELRSGGQVVSATRTWYDAAGRAWKTTDEFDRATIIRYDAFGRQIESRTQSRDATGQAVWLVTRSVYDAYGRVVLATDQYVEAGDGVGDDLPVASPPVLATRTIYDTQGRAVEVQRRADVVVEVSALPDAQWVSEVETYGRWISSAKTFHDARGRVARRIAADGQVTDFEYDERSRVIAAVGHPLAPAEVAITDVPAGAAFVRLRTESEFNADGLESLRRINVWQWEAADGSRVDLPTDDPNVTSPYQYDAAQEIRYAYDAFGNRTRITFADGSYALTRYSQEGWPVADMEAVAADVDAVWSEELRSFIVQGSAGAAPQVLPTRLFEYDSAGRLIAVELPAVADSAASAVTTRPRYEYGYDEYGATNRIRDPLGRETWFSHDSRGRQLSRTLPLGFGPDGVPSTGDDPAAENGTRLFTERFEYDDRGRATRHVSFEGVVTEFLYDDDMSAGFSSGRLMEQRFYASEAEYADGMGTPAETWAWTYDAYGREVAVRQDRGGDVWEVLSDYNRVGLLARLASPAGTLVYQYDDLGRPISTQVFDPFADPATSVPRRTIASTYDALGRLQSVSDDLDTQSVTDVPQTVRYTYDLLGNLRRTELPGGLTTELTYDVRNRLERLTHFATAGTLADGTDRAKLAEFTSTYAADGKRTRADEVFWLDVDDDPATAAEPRANRIDWTYDAVGRLVEESLDHFDDRYDQTDQFTYDLTGNRAAFARDRWDPSLIDEVITYDYDANDRLLGEQLDRDGDGISDRSTRYRYDATQQTGRLVVDPATGERLSGALFAYDLQGRLLQAETYRSANGQWTPHERVRYSYDASGLRVAAATAFNESPDPAAPDWTPGLETQYLVDPHNHTGFGQVLEARAYDPRGMLVESLAYSIGLDEFAQTRTYGESHSFDPSATPSPDTHVFLHDPHTSVRLVVDPDATAIAQLYTYSAYGELLAVHGSTPTASTPSGLLTDVLYSGEHFDPRIQQQYLRARYYDPATGRFNRLDPFVGKTQDPQSLHKYLYAYNDPVNRIDPDGRFPGFISPFLPHVLGTIVHSHIGNRFLPWASLRGNVAWRNQQNRTITSALSGTVFPNIPPFSFRPDLVEWRLPTVVDLYEIKPSDIILGAPFYLADSAIAASQLARNYWFPLSAMNPGFTFAFGTSYVPGFKVWTQFVYVPGWKLVTWNNYAAAPGVILYDFVPDQLGLALEAAVGLGTVAAAYVIQRQAALITVQSAAARGVVLVNADRQYRASTTGIGSGALAASLVVGVGFSISF